MANYTVKTRVQLKNDTEENWNKAINFIPLKGELIVYNAESGQNIDKTRLFPRFKVGDGITTVVNLPFSSFFTQSDWEEEDTDSQEYIKNKPTIPTIMADTSANWAANINYTPALNSIIIYTDAQIKRDGQGNVIKIPSMKIGDGITACADLPFVDAGTLSGVKVEDLRIQKLDHSITFGAHQAYTFDGSADVVVPVYLGGFI